MSEKPIYFYSKYEDYGWLSNFSPSPIIIDGHWYPTVEHYYQSQKTIDPEIREWISRAPKPYLAMAIGRRLRPEDGFLPNWEDVKLKIMRLGLERKFEMHDNLKRLLLETGDASIHEDSPTDKFWGVRGSDWLGKLLMEIREEIRRTERLKYPKLHT